jgi:hypothetical protein
MERRCGNCIHWWSVEEPYLCQRFPAAVQKRVMDVCGEWSWDGKGQPPGEWVEVDEGAVVEYASALSKLKNLFWGHHSAVADEGDREPIVAVSDAIDTLKRSVAKETPPLRPNPLSRVCSYCKVEYAKGEPGARVSHGICPACNRLLVAMQEAGYTAGQANDLVAGMAEGKDNPHEWAKAILEPEKLPELLGALSDWHAAHHREDPEG